MKDIILAKELLEKEDYALVLVKEGKVLFTSRERGIKPMYILVKEMKEISEGASIADRVIGRGAALLSSYLKISEVYGQVMSQEAIKVFEDANIDYGFEEVCKRIKNRDKTDLCPIEKLSLGIKDPIIFIDELERFFKSK